MADGEGFDWKKSLQNNYFIVALSLLIAGGTGAITGYATVNEFVERKFDEFAKGRSLVTKKELIESQLPKDTVGLFLGKCPEGWREFNQATGRYLVISGATQQNLVGTQVGLALIGPEDRPAGQHTHGYVIDEHVNRQGTVQLEFRNPGGGHTPAGSRATDAGTGLKPGTNAPYVFVMGCLKG